VLITAWVSKDADPATSAMLFAKRVSLAGDTSRLLRPRSRIAAAVHGLGPEYLYSVRNREGNVSISEEDDEVGVPDLLYQLDS
jgi:hypothetical protein